MKLLSKAVTKQENNKELIEKHNNNVKEKLYNVDSIENDKLEELIQLQLKLDKQKKEDISSTKEVEHENKIIENILQEDSQSSESGNDDCEEEDYDYCIDDDDDHSSCPSNFDEWMKWNEKGINTK